MAKSGTQGKATPSLSPRPKKFKLTFYGFMSAVYACAALFGYGAFLNGQGQELPLVILMAVCAAAVFFPIILIALYNYGGEEARFHFSETLLVSENREQLSKAGFDADQFNHVEMMVYKEIVADDYKGAASHPFIRELHSQYDLRKMAEEIEKAQSRKAG